ncbi:MAG TPA: AMP-binding protein [Baekduia sp.]|uniref:class I adenylate-forming enzyme family protein n=1 Tax=Baekduia sp. TaxID=2600305 RepID=UPI002D7A0BE9|nr:AMP-binding protein [Baekduia sp.]HET6507882.1 AMP-binding protein [Baekduia sp.]
MLDAAVARRPDAAALVDGAAPERRLTYRELDERARRIAAVLLERLAPGDHLALWAPNSIDWVCVQFGAGLAGVVLVTVNPAYQRDELRHVLVQSRARMLVHAEEHRGRDLAAVAAGAAEGAATVEHVEALAALLARADRTAPLAVLPAVAHDAVAQIQYTSGTTGVPKGAMLTHGGIAVAYTQVARGAGVTPDEPPTWINAMPLFHCGGAGVATIGTVSHAGTQVVMPAWDAGTFLALAEAERGTITLAVPTMLVGLLEHPSRAGRDLRSLSTILTGGATVPRDLVLRVERELDARVLITFGQTESHGTMCMTRPGDAVDDIAATVGYPLDHVDVRIADPDTGATLPIGALGEIQVRGGQVMCGYHADEEATAAAIDPDGWLRFGDLGTMDERGYLRVVGRLKDMIIRGGENIYPREIEDALIAHPDVSEVAVVGVADPTWGEEVAAVVRPAPDRDAPLDVDVLHAFCRERLAGYKCPRLWYVVPTFPATPSGKVQKHRLADMIAAGDLEPVASYQRPPRAADTAQVG